MMDRITKSLVDEFLHNENRSYDDSVAFEHFSNYCVLNNIYGSNDFELEDVETGNSAQGMDGFAIIINQKLIQTTDDIDTLIAINKSLSVRFVIIQAKISNTFHNDAISNLFSFSNLFFNDDSDIFQQKRC